MVMASTRLMLDLLSRCPGTNVPVRGRGQPGGRGRGGASPGGGAGVGAGRRGRHTEGQAQDDHAQLDGQQEEARDLPQDLDTGGQNVSPEAGAPPRDRRPLPAPSVLMMYSA